MNTFPVLVTPCGIHDMECEQVVALYRNAEEAKQASIAEAPDDGVASIQQTTLLQMFYYLLDKDLLDNFKDWVNENNGKLLANCGEIDSVVYENSEIETDFDVDCDFDCQKECPCESSCKKI